MEKTTMDLYYVNHRCALVCQFMCALVIRLCANLLSILCVCELVNQVWLLQKKGMGCAALSSLSTNPAVQVLRCAKYC